MLRRQKRKESASNLVTRLLKEAKIDEEEKKEENNDDKILTKHNFKSYVNSTKKKIKGRGFDEPIDTRCLLTPNTS